MSCLFSTSMVENFFNPLPTEAHSSRVVPCLFLFIFVDCIHRRNGEKPLGGGGGGGWVGKGDSPNG